MLFHLWGLLPDGINYNTLCARSIATIRTLVTFTIVKIGNLNPLLHMARLDTMRRALLGHARIASNNFRILRACVWN